MIETTADARRRGLYNPDYYITETNKHLFPPISEDATRKECKHERIFLYEQFKFQRLVRNYSRTRYRF
jgi:hypothetical protein